MVLSMIFFPNTLTTNALWLGCNSSQSDIRGSTSVDSDLVRRRLSEFDGEVFHPMLLPTILADFERDRLVRLVREVESNFMQKFYDLQYKESQYHSVHAFHAPTSLTEPPNKVKRSLTEVFKDSGKRLTDLSRSRKPHVAAPETVPNAPVPPQMSLASDREPLTQLSIKTSHLRNGLENWRKQLLKMIHHVDELQQIDLGAMDNTLAGHESRDATVASLVASGRRIKTRLEELVDECDEFARKCTHVIGGVMLATQLVSYIDQHRRRSRSC